MLILALAVPATRAGAASPCIAADPANLEPAVLSANVIVVASVATEARGLSLVPETFLRGTVSRESISPTLGTALPGDCPPAALFPDDRVLAFIVTDNGAPVWPAASAVFVLRDGVAARSDGAVQSLSEAALIERVRALTGQQAVPPASGEKGANLDWSGTIAPVGVLLLAVFGIGLVLMRLWHRIDPS